MQIELKNIDIFVPKVKKNKKKTLDKKTGAFSVIIDDLKAISEIITKAATLGLSMDRGTIDPTINHSTLAFFFDSKHDIEYIHTATESRLKDRVPRLSAKEDKYTIFMKLREASAEKKALRALLKTKGKTLRELVLLKKEYKKAYKNKFIDLLNPKEKIKNVSSYEEIYIEVSEHYVQVGTKFFSKNPNDIILFGGIQL